MQFFSNSTYLQLCEAPLSAVAHLSSERCGQVGAETHSGCVAEDIYTLQCKNKGSG